jgi:sugar phosphate isomerase/epimerase
MVARDASDRHRVAATAGSRFNAGMNTTSRPAHGRGSPPELYPRIGACSWSLRPETPGALVNALTQLELRTCQIALVPFVSEPSKWADAAGMLRDSGIEPVSGMLAMIGEDYSTLESIRRTGGVALDENWRANLDRAKAVADVAADQGIKLVTFHAGFLPHDSNDPRRRILIQRLRAVLDIFSGQGISLGLETGQESAATLLEFLGEPELREVGVNFDPANMILYGMGDPVKALRLLIGRVVQIHIKDAIASREPGQWGQETPVGEGSVNWPAFFELVRGAGRPINLIIEREAGPNRLKDIAQARDLVRRLAGSSAGKFHI